MKLLLKTQKHFFPDLSTWINRIPDPRRKEQSTYSQAHLLWTGILLFMMHLGSRRQMRFERDSDIFKQNLTRICGQFDAGFVADPDTLAYYAERVPCEALENILASINRVQHIANKGGRLRWKIENEGFNVQKNDGYEMEHPYSERPNGFRVFYILLLMAHYISQLILHGNLIHALAKRFGSAKNFARRLAESLRNHLVSEDLPLPGQIRFRPP